jgi:(1->4)-alpha-D-glucan 1-alpha-D-glucosylmutase
MAELRATYRLQLTPSFGFADARRLIPYLRRLGVSHLYLSPSLQARAGSNHGYDVIDPARISEQLGGRAGFVALADAAHGAGLGIVLDVVPNHMAAVAENRYWSDAALRGRFFDLDPSTGRHRRFFDVDELAGVRQEDPEVFAATHELVLGLVREGLVDGLRIDHPDGLADPAGYLRALREGGAGRVWVEKILATGERLRDWPVCGTVGYEFAADATALLIDPAGEAPLTELWQSVCGERHDFAQVAAQAKLELVRGTFAPEVEWLWRELGQAAPTTGEHSPRPGERPSAQARRELERALCALEVYRTYIEPGTAPIARADRDALAPLPPAYRRLLGERLAPAAFITRFQQTTPAIAAKGVEDTALYRYLRLTALCEVGCNPARFGITPSEFHQGCLERAQRFPHTLLAGSTHDTKRSADVRARLGALACIPQEWQRAVDGWMALTERHRRGGAPDDVERYLIFQTLAGAWPICAQRMVDYVQKALREAKRNTSWVSPNRDWEQAVGDFVCALYEDQPFIASLQRLLAVLAPLGRRAAHAELALRLTAPGVADIYQGDELELRALVDPDNRRPVDFARRAALLERLSAGKRMTAGPRAEPTSAAVHTDPDADKLALIASLLALRTRRPEAFAPTGAYQPLDAEENALAFTRAGEVVTVVALPRAGAADPPALLDAPGGRWRELLSGQEHTLSARKPVGELVGGRGFAVLERVGPSAQFKRRARSRAKRGGCEAEEIPGASAPAGA